MKEGGGLDNLAVGWQRPGGLTAAADAGHTSSASVQAAMRLNTSDPSASSDQSDTIRILDIAALEPRRHHELQGRLHRSARQCGQGAVEQRDQPG
jgi:hypothetical protein